MQPNLSPIERAFQLAATGRYSTVSEIKLQLAREGYPKSRSRGGRARQAWTSLLRPGGGMAGTEGSAFEPARCHSHCVWNK